MYITGINILIKCKQKVYTTGIFYMIFKVRITETLEKSVVVEAENEKEAIQLIDNAYRAADESCILSAENFTGVEFKAEKL